MQFKAKLPVDADIGEDVSYNFKRYGAMIQKGIEEECERTLKYMPYLEVLKETEEKLKSSDPYAFCERLCNKIAYYISKLHKVDILAMTVDFYQDENGKIWLFYAKNIRFRENSKYP